MGELSPAWIALIGTIFGGAGLKIIESWLNRAARKDTAESQIRQELRSQIEGLKTDLNLMREEIDKTEAEMDAWREKYWQLRAEYVQIHTELTGALQKLKQVQQEVDKAPVNPVDSES